MKRSVYCISIIKFIPLTCFWTPHLRSVCFRKIFTFWNDFFCLAIPHSAAAFSSIAIQFCVPHSAFHENTVLSFLTYDSKPKLDSQSLSPTYICTMNTNFHEDALSLCEVHKKEWTFLKTLRNNFVSVSMNCFVVWKIVPISLVVPQSQPRTTFIDDVAFVEYRYKTNK